jgi:hypothetical protein
MNSMIFKGVPFDSAQGTPFIDFLSFRCVLKRTVLLLIPLLAIYKESNVITELGAARQHPPPYSCPHHQRPHREPMVSTMVHQ